jgi:hypothetical protein
MDCKVKAEQDGSYTFSVNMKLDGSMLEMENDIQGVVKKLGIEATLRALKNFDTDGSPIKWKGEVLSSKGKQKKRSKRPMEKEK